MLAVCIQINNTHALSGYACVGGTSSARLPVSQNLNAGSAQECTEEARQGDVRVCSAICMVNHEPIHRNEQLFPLKYSGRNGGGGLGVEWLGRLMA